MPQQPAPAAPEVRPLSPDEEAFLRAFRRAILVLNRVMDFDLVAAHGLSGVEYEVLMHLSEAPDRRLRMSELAAVCAMSLSGMTRIVSRLEREQLVERVRCDSDLRGFNAVLTDAGLARLQAAWPTHLASVRRHMMDHLEGVDLPAVTEAFQNFATEACAEAAAACAEFGDAECDEIAPVQLS
ncbi:MAG TPA: MarR family winged helix-turn-helix transcriptional regulator [Jatrophihabitantaceae bacterium]|nr:MarR family winged helix-turn-helix transcriptional regulator [Jatrophihabitantaceae bacterium]